MLALIGKKIDQSQRFLENGTRIPVTRIDVPGNVVVDIKSQEKNKYSAIALGYGQNPKNHKKSLLGIVKKAKLNIPPILIKEIRLKEEADLPELGTVIRVEEVFQPGDIIQVTGMSKGKGFAGGVKRHHFAGGPKTHGQSDRHRAPGSIGQGTTPGRVYKGKKMAGNMGHENVTVTNLKVISIEGDMLLVAGLVPGPANNMLIIKKTGELGKKFVPLTKTQDQLDAEKVEQAALAEQTAKEAEEAKLQEEKLAALEPAPADVVVDASPVEPEAQVEQTTEETPADVEVEPAEDATAVEEVNSEVNSENVVEDKEENKEVTNGTK